MPNTPGDHNTDALTWQQEQEFGAVKEHRKRNPGVMALTPGDSVPPHLRKREVTVPAPDAYIPPHLRKKKASPAASPPAAPVQTSLDPAERRPASPPSPPSTGTPTEKAVATQWAGWDEPKSTPSAQPPKRGNPRWPAKPPARRHAWPKNRDMRALPSGDDVSDGGVSFKSNSNGDPNYDVAKLMDWNGDWLPPPVEWSARNRFSNRHFGASIEKWINGHDQSCTQDLTNDLKSLDFLGTKVDGEHVLVDGVAVADKVVTKELVPRTWVPTKIEGDAPQQFWRALPSRAPPALSDVDLNEQEPYWSAYPEDSKSCFLAPPEAPTALLDPGDAENNQPKATMSATEALRFIKQKKLNRARKTEERRSRPIPPLPAYQYPSQLHPTANIYLRPVIAADAAGIRELYNYYISETISAPEYRPRTLDQIVDRIHAITSEKLPYIVAIAKGNQPRGPQHYVSERIVGIASIDDFCDKGSMYRFTFELELYVHPGYTRKGIAKCLLDRLLSTVSTGYQTKGGYQWVNRGEYLKHDAERVVKTINVSVPHENTDNLVWMSKFLKDFRFCKAGHLKKMGAKQDKIVDVTIYQHITTEVIDPSVPPRDPF